jgi:hypothetical protein
MAAELLKRQFTDEIQPLLFPNNDWLGRSKNDDAYVNANTVELPHSGTITGAALNPSSFPLTVEKRTDVATNYAMDVIATLPTHLEINEDLTVSYDKRQDILKLHAHEIMKRAASKALYSWAGGAATYIPTTGTGRSATGVSQTGLRKAVTAADLISARRRFFDDDIVGGTDGINGIAIVTPSMYSDLLAIPQFTDGEKYGRSNIPTGVISRAFGFDFYIRSTTVVTDGADALKAEGAAAAATDQDAAVFYSPEFVRKAKSSAQILIDDDKPEYLGSLINGFCRFGAAPTRNDNKGVYLMYEDTTV